MLINTASHCADFSQDSQLIWSSNTSWCPNTHQFYFSATKAEPEFCCLCLSHQKPQNNSTCFFPGMSHRGQTLHRYWKPSESSGINKWVQIDGQVLSFGQATNSARADTAGSPSLNLYQTCWTCQGANPAEIPQPVAPIDMSTAGVWKRS